VAGSEFEIIVAGTLHTVKFNPRRGTSNRAINLPGRRSFSSAAIGCHRSRNLESRQPIAEIAANELSTRCEQNRQQSGNEQQSLDYAGRRRPQMGLPPKRRVIGGYMAGGWGIWGVWRRGQSRRYCAGSVERHR
jgi:hypothetical protein